MNTAAAPLSLLESMREFVDTNERHAALNTIREYLHTLSPQHSQPVDLVRWVPLEMVEPNDYNPNSVAATELGLLATSLRHDGYTQPVVTIWDEVKGKYVIVDGFHRYYTMKASKDIQDATGGYLPIVVIDKPLSDRMASTIRHNRARGRHMVTGMSSMVFSLLEQGWDDAEICNQLGLSPEELTRLKHITGFSKLFANAEYRRAWMTERQVRIAHKWKVEHGEGGSDEANPFLPHPHDPQENSTPHG